MGKQNESLTKIKEQLPQNLALTLDSLLMQVGGEERDEVVERLGYYISSRSALVGEKHRGPLYNEFFNLLAANPKHAVGFLRHSEGYYQGASIETELAAYEIWKNSVRLFDMANENLLPYFISSSVRPIKTPVDDLQKRKERAYATVAVLEENLEWLNSLEQELAGEVVLQIGRVYAQVTDEVKARRLVRFYRNIEPKLREMIHNKEQLSLAFGGDIDKAKMYPYETLDDHCNTIEKSLKE